ncbi:hypothetical protein PENFLA_c027G06033 [Penicillium flavigenum]|uniref:Uncharacterized protein n=1 Tax=Penicillium flavigenum TaxID=254877 RepID=A0A1V6SRB0_9EURO|nr:hypothetical protein PENFLA_c027G06033 [Penicillium flavigenum]
MSLAMIAPPHQYNQGLFSMLTLQSSTMPGPGTQGNAKLVWETHGSGNSSEGLDGDGKVRVACSVIPSVTYTFNHPYRPVYGANLYQPLLERPMIYKMHDSNHSFDAVRRLREVRARRGRRKTLGGGMKKKGYWTEDSVHYWYRRCPQLPKECNSDLSKTPSAVQRSAGMKAYASCSVSRRSCQRLPAKAASPKDDTDSEGGDDESEANESSEYVDWMKPAVEDWIQDEQKTENRKSKKHLYNNGLKTIYTT